MSLTKLKGLIAIETITGTEFINPELIIRIEASDRQSVIYIYGRKDEIRSIWNFGKFLDLFKPIFFQCHRSHIINLMYLKSFKKKTQTLILEGDHSIPLSKERYIEFKNRTYPYIIIESQI